MNEVVQLTATRPRFGGLRWWFRCPGEGCGRRVGVLCLPHGGVHFRCRRCHGLSYDSRQNGHRYRALYEESPNRLADRSYEEVRPFYHLGHLASRHPDYQQRPFQESEADLQKGWTPDLRARYGEWVYVRQFASESFTERTKRQD